MFGEYDICWCADSERCTNKECFRHTSRYFAKWKEDKITLVTMANLMYTELCPLEEKGDR